MARKEEKKKEKKDIAALFIPAGLFIGMGLGFLYNQLVAGMFIGLGVGFVLTAVGYLLKKK